MRQMRPLAFIGACIQNTYPLLALQTLETFCAKFPHDPNISEANKTRTEIETSVPKLLQDFDLPEERALELGTLNEKGRFLVEIGQSNQARQLFEDLLQLAPNLSPALNNLSLILCSQGELREAIALAQKVLEKNQNNFQALGNLVRFYLLSGETELAEKQLKQLKELNNEIPDIWLKKAEAFSWFGDNTELVELGKEAESSEVSKNLTAPFWHCIAVGYANSGQEKKARQLWQKSLKISPTFDYAKQNLRNIKLPIGERTTPWAFDMREWIPSIVMEDIEQIIKTDSENNKKEKSIAKQIIKKHPQIINLIPILLKRGSPLAREFAINISIFTKNPELLLALKEFAFSTYGTDQQRFQVAQYLNKEGLIPSGAIKLWVKGKQTEVMMMGIELNENPTVTHSKKVQKLGQNGVAALKKREGEKAESIFLEALKLEPSAPDLKFNLVGAYMLQQREEEANELLKTIHEEHPDYAFATIALARLNLENQEIEEAEELLKPLLKRQQFNYLEFCQLCQAHIELAMKKKTPEVAHSWLGIWKEIGDEDDSNLDYWCNRLEGKSSWFFK